MDKTSPTLWRYVVPASQEHCDYGGIFVLASDGYFSCITDWGNYAFRWTGFGSRDFRDFLIGLGTDYLLSKIADETYDGTKSYHSIKDAILQLRRTRSWSAKQAREEMDLLQSWTCVENEFEFGCWYMETTLPDASEYRRTSYHGQTRGFADRLWPRFVALLKVDIEESKRAYALARAQAGG